MSIQDNLKAKLPSIRNKTVRYMGDALHVVLLSFAEYERERLEDGDVAEFIARKFLDPGTGKPAFDVGFLRTELTNAALIDLVKLYHKAQNGGVAEDVEKNSGAISKE